MSSDAASILIVDNDPKILRLLAIRLQSLGYDVTTAESGEDALAALPLVQPHVVITDLRMSGMDGMALFDAIHRVQPTVPVIVLTGHGTIPDAVAATRRGVFSFLTKPYEGDVLLEQMERALRVSGRLSPVEGSDDDKSWRSDIITHSVSMERLLSKARLVAASGARVSIIGPSGSGKELLARAIHRASARRDKPFVPINCAAIPEALLESELFGYVKGAFTGATHDRRGLFQSAHEGTLFLDEIGDMPLSLQAKLLRVLEEKTVRPVGSLTNVPVDVRIISATHRSLEERISAGQFREDVYYRLGVVMLEIPPLSARLEDIPLLAAYFLKQLAAEYSRPATAFSPDASELLVTSAWPGNVRQLHNVVEQVVTLCPSAIVPATFVQEAMRLELQDYASFDLAKRRFERDYLIQLLKITNGSVSRAAKLAGRHRTDLYKLLQRHRLDPTMFKAPRV